MKLLNITELMKQHAKKTSKFCMYISWSEDALLEELIRAAPYLKDYKNEVLTGQDESLIIIFDTEEEMNHYFEQTVGDDGPTKLNNYIGTTRVYALTCSDKGELWNENT